MRGCIHKRGPNTYALVISSGYDPDTGKRRQQWVTVHGTREEAEQRLLVLLSQKGNSKSQTSSSCLLETFLGIWLRDYALPNLTPRTVEGYSSKIKNHIIPGLGKIPLIKLQPQQIQSFYAREILQGNVQKGGKLNARTVRHIHMVLHGALDTAVKWGIIGRNPADAVKPPRAERLQMRVWNEEQITGFLKFIKESEVYSPYLPMFHLALFTGLRRSEFLALAWKDVDLERSRVFVNRSLNQLYDGSLVFSQTKSAAANRAVDITPSTVALLGEQKERHKAYRLMLGLKLNDDDLVFSTAGGKPLRPDTVSQAWARSVLQSGLPRIRLHDARHSHASILLKQGVHPKVVQERLGHASVQTTLDLYSHVAPGMQKDAIRDYDRLVLGLDPPGPGAV